MDTLYIFVKSVSLFFALLFTVRLCIVTVFCVTAKKGTIDLFYMIVPAASWTVFYMTP